MQTSREKVPLRVDRVYCFPAPEPVAPAPSVRGRRESKSVTAELAEETQRAQRFFVFCTSDFYASLGVLGAATPPDSFRQRRCARSKGAAHSTRNFRHLCSVGTVRIRTAIWNDSSGSQSGHQPMLEFLA